MVAGSISGRVAPELHRVISSRPAQLEGVRWLFKAYHGAHLAGCRGCVLGDGMGVGKTVQTIVTVHTLVANDQAKSTLIVTPKGVLAQWAAEFGKFLAPPGKPAVVPLLEVAVVGDGVQAATAERALARLRTGVPVVVLITYAMAARHLPAFTKAGGSVDLLVADEAHALKTPGLARYDAIAGLHAHARFMLSATPLQNNMAELWALVSIAAPGALGTAAWFARVIEEPLEAARADDAPLAALLAGELAAVQLQRLLAPLYLAREQEGGCRQPSAVHTVLVRLTELQRRLYTVLASGMGGEFEGDLAFVKLQNYKKVLLHPWLLVKSAAASHDLGEALPRAWPQSPREMLMLSGKARALVLLLEHVLTNSSERIVVVSSSVAFLSDLVAPYLAQLEAVGRDGFVTICGKAGTVDASQKQFNDRESGVRVCLLSLERAQGLNLVGGSYMVLCDPPWNYKKEKQALGRLWREGQCFACHHVRLGAVGTLDEEIWRRQDSKQGFEHVFRKGQLGEMPAIDRSRLFSVDAEGSGSRLLASLSERRTATIFGAPAMVGPTTDRVPHCDISDCPALCALMGETLVASGPSAPVGEQPMDDDGEDAPLEPAPQQQPTGAPAPPLGARGGDGSADAPTGSLPLVHSLLVARAREWLQ